MRVIRRRKVRLHQLDPAPSIEGILVGKPWRSAGNWVIRQPGILQGPDQTIGLASQEVWVAREKVIFVEILG